MPHFCPLITTWTMLPDAHAPCILVDYRLSAMTYVGDSDGATSDISQVHSSNSSIFLQPGQLSSNAGDVALLYHLDVGHNQARWGGHGDPNVVSTVLKKSVSLIVEAAVDNGEVLQCCRQGLHQD